MPKCASSKSFQTGRPHGSHRSSVDVDLLSALSECLRNKLASEITTKEIADRAGVSAEMIRYYFGGKDGLILSLIKQTSDDFSRRMDELELSIRDIKDRPTEKLLRVLFEFYLENRHITRVSLAEFQKSKSSIFDKFLESRSEVLISRINSIINKLVDFGYYKRSLDSRKLSMTIISMVTGPVTFLNVLPKNWMSEEDLERGDWVEYLANLIDTGSRSEL